MGFGISGYACQAHEPALASSSIGCALRFAAMRTLGSASEGGLKRFPIRQAAWLSARGVHSAGHACECVGTSTEPHLLVPLTLNSSSGSSSASRAPKSSINAGCTHQWPGRLTLERPLAKRGCCQRPTLMIPQFVMTLHRHRVQSHNAVRNRQDERTLGLLVTA